MLTTKCIQKNAYVNSVCPVDHARLMNTI